MSQASNNIVVVDRNNCEQLQDPQSPFILILHKGEDVLDSLVQCAKQMNIKSASLSGLGAFADPTIAYYRLSTQQYENKTFPGIYELISFNGNLTQVDNQIFPHVHVACGDEHHQMVGGHLTHAIVGVTVEITVVPFNQKIHRQMDTSVGLKLISCAMLSR